MKARRFALAGALGLLTAATIAACLPNVALNLGGSSAPEKRAGATGMALPMAAGGLTFGGTSTGSAALLVSSWATSTSYALGQVAQAHGNVCSATTAGTSSATGTGPSTTGAGIPDGPGTDGGTAVVWTCYGPTTFRGILFTDTDSSNALYLGFTSAITAAGVSSGEAVVAGTSLTLPAGLNITSLYAITGGSSVVWTAALTF